MFPTSFVLKTNTLLYVQLAHRVSREIITGYGDFRNAQLETSSKGQQYARGDRLKLERGDTWTPEMKDNGKGPENSRLKKGCHYYIIKPVVIITTSIRKIITNVGGVVG